jgi:glycosyltransferase involved in cell wall biosynthesis
MNKILIINTVYEGGGAARVARDLFGYFNDHGKEVYFAYGRGMKFNNPKLFKFGNLFETIVHLFLVRFFGLEGKGSCFSTKKLIKFIEHEKFDLVNLHNLHGYYLNYRKLIRFLQAKKIPVVWTMHDEWALTWLPAHSMGCTHCKTLKGRCTNRYSYPRNYFPIFAKNTLVAKRRVLLSDWNLTIVASANWLKNELMNSDLKKFPITVITNGIDLEAFKPRDKAELRKKYDLQNDKKFILFSAANLADKNKGMEYIEKLADELHGSSFSLVGVGRGKINKSNVHNLGYITERSKLAEIYSLADIFCFTSAAETFSLSIIEALASGLPVVAFSIPATAEILKNGAGILIPYGDCESLKNQILNLSNEKIKELSVGARGLAMMSFSENKFFDEYSKIY